MLHLTGIEPSWLDVLSRSGIGLWHYDTSTQTFTTDPHTALLWGLPPQTTHFSLDDLTRILPADKNALNRYVQRTDEQDLPPLTLTRQTETASVRLRIQAVNSPPPQPRLRGTIQDITAVAEQDSSLMQANRKLHDLHELAGMGYWEFSLSTRSLIWSNELFRSFGLDPNQVQAPTPEELNQYIHPDDRGNLHQARLACIDNRQPYQVEVRQLQPDGSYRWVLVKGKPVYDENGDFTGLIGINFDIHHRKTRELLYGAIIENTTDEIWTVDADLQLTSFNSLFGQSLKWAYGIDLAVGMNLPDVFEKLHMPDIAHRYRSWYQACLTGQTLNETEYFCIDGVDLYREIRLNPIRRNGQIMGVSIFSRNVTEQKKASLQTLEYKNLLQNVLDSALSGIMTFKAVRNESGEIVDLEWIMVNYQASSIIGESNEALIGSRLLAQLPSARDSGLFSTYREVIESGRPVHFEQYYSDYRNTGFEQWFEIIAVKFEDGVSVTFSNITGRKVAEAKVKTYHERLRSAFNSSQNAFFIYDAVIEANQCVDFVLADANDLGFRTVSIPREEMLNHRMSQATPNIMQQGLFERFIDVYKTGNPLETEVSLSLERFNARWINLSCTRLEKGIFISIRDITRAKEREQLLIGALDNEKRLNDQLAMREEELTTREEELRQSLDYQTELLQELQQKESDLKALINNTSDGIFSVDAHYRFNTFNQACERMIRKGNGQQLAVGLRLNELRKDWIETHLLPFVSRALQGEKVRHEYFLNPPGGPQCYYELSCNPIPGTGKQINGAAVIIRDVTEKKKSDLKLQDNELKFRSISQVSNDALWDWDIVADHIEWSAGFIRLYGFDLPQPEYSIQVWVDSLHPQDRERVVEKIFRHVHTPGTEDWEDQYRICRPDGTQVYVVDRALIIRDETGRGVRMLGGIQDVTQLRLQQLQIEEALRDQRRLNEELASKEAELLRNQARLRRSEEKFAKAFDLSPDIVMLIQLSDFVIIDVNKKVEELTGYTQAELIGERSATFKVWKTSEDEANYFGQLQQSGKVEMEARLRRKDSSFFYASISTRRITIGEVDYLLNVIRDISEKKDAQEIIQRSEYNLNAIINNTDINIWSIDQEYNFIVMNDRFRKGVRKAFGAVVDNGDYALTERFPAYLRSYWEPLYTRALAGEKIRLEHFLDSLNLFFEYSLHPIEVGGKITGVAIYARDITDRIEKERTIKENVLELAAANKKMGELKLMALRSAMNPHFIFNSLSSIQYFVARNDRQNALNYLSYFSKLIRGILHASIRNRISLADELELLRYYISLELLRFEDKFEVQYQLAPGLDPDSIEVPSLLIQPFVENAILHGLYNRESRGLLQIRVFTEGHNLVVEVEDNGVGRAAAARIREASMQTHQSVGIHITQERLAIINQEHTVSVEIVDLYHEQKATGTLVKITIRLDD